MIRAQGGDRAAFTQLAADVGNRFFPVAHRILRDADSAEDAAQQALIAVWRELPRLRDPERFEPWAYRILVRACYREARKAPRRAAEAEYLDISDGQRDVALSVADRDQLERGFRRLTPEQRTAVVLQHYLGYSLAQIAELLDLPVGTVGSRLHAAKRSLRAALEADAREAGTQDVLA